MNIIATIRKKNTLKNYDFLFTLFRDEFGERDISAVTPEEILSFLTRITEGNKHTTKRNRYSGIKAFFNYVRNTIDYDIPNPCDTSILKKIFKNRRPRQWKIIEKDLIDEIIFRTTNPRNRIMLELMAKGGMRVGEVPKIRPVDIKDAKMRNEFYRIRGWDPESGLQRADILKSQGLSDVARDL